jgi:hypothetical protein
MRATAATARAPIAVHEMLPAGAASALDKSADRD